jgi:hypothetical protein
MLSVMEELSAKYGVNLADMPVGEVLKMVDEEDRMIMEMVINGSRNKR